MTLLNQTQGEQILRTNDQLRTKLAAVEGMLMSMVDAGLNQRPKGAEIRSHR